MVAEGHLGVNKEHVAYDTIDGEVVVVHFVHGYYYAMSGTAAQIWNWLVEGYRVSDIADHIRCAYQDADGNAIYDFVRRLIDENLLEERGPLSTRCDPLPAIDTSSGFVPPEFEKHEDMQELIVLDPIHEVDSDSGWPHKAV